MNETLLLVLLYLVATAAFASLIFLQGVVTRPRGVIELILSPHITCPPLLYHLSLKQWRAYAKKYSEKDGMFFDDWVEKHQLPNTPGRIPKPPYSFEHLTMDQWRSVRDY